ncbi:MAG: nucleotide sugar dehydrogenase [Bilophila sp.]
MSALLSSLSAFQDGSSRVGIVGLGYVGLPLAVAFARHFAVLGFDMNTTRVCELAGGVDRTGEVAQEALVATRAEFTSDAALLHGVAVVIVAVPTPIDAHRNPDLAPIIGASRTVGQHLSPGTVVVYESTVYPGVTEEVCVPVLEEASGLVCGRDFTVGYSPERINPGDKVHTLETIVKIVSASDRPTRDLLEALYGTVVSAGIHCAPSIRVAEAAKVIENTQRDLNIALMNELSVIFDRLGIDTLEVLEAASTKWNFLPFRPGLVGGHCIGVDPYYLTFKAEELGCHPQVILAGRRINDGMGKRVAETCIKLLIRQERLVNAARVGILGFTFKENVPDLRNTRVIDVVRELEEYGVCVLVHDPLADAEEALREYNVRFAALDELTGLDALILAVPHQAYADAAVLLPDALRQRFVVPDKALLLDVKGYFTPAEAANAGIEFWRL